MTEVEDEIDLEVYIPALINILSTRLSSSASVTYRSLFGLSVLEWRILVLLARKPGLSAQQVGSVVGQHKGPISRAVRVLESKSLVRVGFAKKGHRHELHITPAGMALYRASIPVAMERQRRLLADLSQEERAQLRSLLKRMIARVPDVARVQGESSRD